MASKATPQGLFDGKIVAAASVDALRKLNPRALAKNPVIFVTEVVSLVVTLFFIRDLVTAQRDGPVLGPDRRLAVVHGAVRQFRRGRRRRARQGASRRSAPHPQRHPRQALYRSGRTSAASSKA